MNQASAASREYAIETEGLTKSFGSSFALRGVDLKVAGGETLVVLGPNGAGKTTLIKVLATIMNPSAGKITISGLNPKSDAEEIRRRIGVVTHQVFFYSNLTAHENLEFYGRIYDISHPQERIYEVVSMVDMTSRLHDRVGTLSRGMQQRLSLARALLHRPAIMLLDEPETGLDQQALSALWQVVKGEEEEKRTLIMTTHNLERGLELGDRFIILREGRIVCEESSSGLDLAALRQAYEESTKAKV